MPTTTVDLLNYEDVPNLDPGTPIGANWLFLARDPATNNVYEVLATQLATLVNPAVTATVPPVVSLDPVANALVGIQLSLSAHATAAPGSTITKVEFFSGAFKIGQATATPYVITYAPDTVGQFPYTAKATDSFGNSATAQQLVVVSAPASGANLPPVVSLSVSSQQIVVGQSVVLTAVAQDPDGSIARVEYFDFSDKIGETTALPYVFNATPTGTGTHVYTAKATDNRGLPTASDPVPVVVRATGLVAPDAPTNVTATAGNNAVSVTATPPVNQGSSPVTSYHVFRNGAGAPLASSVALPFVDNTAVNGTEYYYELMAHNSAGDSPKSARSNTATPIAPVVNTAPGAPTGVYGTASSNLVQVYLTAPANTGGVAISGYNIYRGGTLLGNTPGTTYTDGTALNGQTYTYTAAAVNSVGTGPLSNTATVVMPAAVVTYSYQTTGTDFTNKCGQGTSGASVTRTSTVSLADAQALAFAAITCPVASTTFAVYSGPTITNAPTGPQVAALPAQQFSAGAHTLSFNCNGTFPTYAEPDTQPIRTVIKDVNDFDVTGDITRQTLLVNAVSCNVYTHNNPQYDPAFILKFL